LYCWREMKGNLERPLICNEGNQYKKIEFVEMAENKKS